MPPPPAIVGPAYPSDLLDYLTRDAPADFRVAGHAFRQGGMDRFNAALHAISPASPSLGLGQVLAAARRAVEGRPGDGPPAFVVDRMACLARLRAMSADPVWQVSGELLRLLGVLAGYEADPAALIPAATPVVGWLDVAILVDVALHQVRAELAEYEDFCRFRQAAVDRALATEWQAGPTRLQWLEAIAPGAAGCPGGGDARDPCVPDPRTSLFQVT